MLEYINMVIPFAKAYESFLKRLQVKLQMNYELLKVQSCETNAPLYIIFKWRNC